MRARLARLAALTGATALVVTGALGAVPTANAAPDDNLVVTIKDTAGRPTAGAVILMPVDDPDSGSWIQLGEDPSNPGAPVAARSTFEETVPAGSYGVAWVTGWGGMNCLGVSPCAITAMSGGGIPGAPALTVTAGLTVPASGRKTLSLTSGLPVLRGTGQVGKTLTVDYPAGFDQMIDAIKILAGSMPGGGVYGPPDPVVVWKRNGQAVTSATGSTYVPTAADAGKKLSATVNPSLIMSMFMSTTGAVPSAYTTNAIAVKKVATKLGLKVPGKVKQGSRPKARLTAKGGGDAISGWVRVQISTGGSLRVMVRKGYAEVKLPKLTPGKHKITATFLKTKVYNPSKAKATVVVKKK